MPLIDYFLALALGLIGGSFGTIVGIGGGLLFVPFLLLFLHTSAQQTVGTSLAVVFFNALSGSSAYMRQHRVDLRSGLIFAAAILPSTVFGAWLSGYLNTTILSAVAGILLIASSIFILLSPVKKIHQEEGNPKRTLKDRDGHTFSYSPRIGLGILFSMLIGVTYGLLGIGGGIILVPLMVFILGFPAHIATATSQFILVISAFFGAGSHLVLGNILFIPALMMVIGAIPGAQLGAIIAKKMAAGAITHLLIAAMLILGGWLLFKAL